jgi:protein O-mannosyl-transferase
LDSWGRQVFLIRMNISRTKLVGVALAIFAVTVWLYWPSVHGKFLSGDDINTYLLPSVRLHGLTWNAVKWAFTCTDDYYQPLVRLSHVLDYQIWGRNPLGHHAVSVVVHALNAALVFGFLWTLLGAAPLTTGERFATALGVATVFAIHPLQMESVDWVAGRTQLLCTMFGMACLWAYVLGSRRWVVWGLYVLALLCKPMAVSFPFVMLAIDYFPLRRHERLGWGRLLWEKAIWIALAVAAGLATLITKSQMRQMIPLAAAPLSQRVFLAFESLTFYPLKLIWTSHLSPYYPLRLGLSLDQWPVLASVLIVVTITAVVVLERRRLPALAAAWGAYVMLVLPVSGLVPIGTQVVAPRYAYVAILPLLLVVGGAAVWAWRFIARAIHHERRSTMATRVALVGFLGYTLWSFGSYTRNLIPVWRNDETLWRATLVEFPDSDMANRLLAEALLAQGRASEALKYAQRDVELAPRSSAAHDDLGSVLAQLGRATEATQEHEEAVQLRPDSYRARYNLGLSLEQEGKVEEAVEQWQQAARLKPDFFSVHLNLGTALARLGRMSEAVEEFEKAARIDNDSAEAHFNLGSALAKTGNIGEAVTHYEEAVRIRPEYAEAQYNLANALSRAGRIKEAIGHYEQALRVNPELADAQNNLAWLLATRLPAEGGDPVRAVALAERACKLTDNRAAPYLDTLAAAYAASGRFDDAVGTAQKAIQLADSTMQTQLVSKVEMRLELYRGKHAYYEPENATGSRTP